jgi:hypothetical protein
VAGRLGVSDPSRVKRNTELVKTRFDHQWEVRRVCGLREFAEVEEEFVEWPAACLWTSGDGPKTIFLDAVTWVRVRVRVRVRKILLPGVARGDDAGAAPPPFYFPGFLSFAIDQKKNAAAASKQINKKESALNPLSNATPRPTTAMQENMALNKTQFQYSVRSFMNVHRPIGRHRDHLQRLPLCQSKYAAAFQGRTQP